MKYTITITNEDGKVVESVEATQAPLLTMAANTVNSSMKVLDRDTQEIIDEIETPTTLICGCIFFTNNSSVSTHSG